MNLHDLPGVRLAERDRVLYVTLDFPPLNLMNSELVGSLETLVQALQTEGELRVVVFRSADPEFFIAHYDMSEDQDDASSSSQGADTVGRFGALMCAIEDLPQVTIGQLEGRARGAGSELLLALDMRFAALGRARLAQPEVGVGVVPGGGGTQRLPLLTGRGRALEILLSADDYDAATAERYGWVNRALPADELNDFVDALAKRISTFPSDALIAAKRAVNTACRASAAGLEEEMALITELLRGDEAGRRIQLLLDQGAQTRHHSELELPRLLSQL